MIYLIGGPPRVGKTKLVEQVLKQKPIHALSTDSVRYMLRQTVPRHDLSPELFYSYEKHIESEDFERYLGDQNAESDALWPYLVKLMEFYSEDGYDLLLEGVANLPSLINQLELPHRSIIIGNNYVHHTDTVSSQLNNNVHDWLHSYNPQQQATFERFFQAMSEWFREEAARYHIPYYELHDDQFDEDLQKAATILLG